MKYLVYAKILGTYMPEKKSRIGDCIVEKSYEQYHFEDDRPCIPVRSKDTEFHCLENGVKNYIYYPQNYISSRTFESEYIIKTEVATGRPSEAIENAFDRFSNVCMTLSMVAKNKTVTLNKKRFKKGSEYYDFEIFSVFIKRNRRYIRIKIPQPLVNGRNFFPKKFPKNFVNQAKKYLTFNDRIFQKGLIYFQRATFMKYTGIFNDLEIILNAVKCIELICTEIAKENRFGLSKTAFNMLYTKDIFQKAGSKIKVTQKTINKAKHLWDERSKGDVAHSNEYYNPYSKRSVNTFVNIDDLESTVNEFLIKYYKSITPPQADGV